ncbi:GTPase family protein [Chroococcus sp. FPU101]|uniref:GTPase family protein n=1 Tax=Chroococcus sp. FPU101 TaxID=1974212 RepID=UPI001A8BF856|nr:GTPase family protein [Chroococcus sp. FPU101]GFE70777.1 Small GTP-binding protein domain [Chroococcus sp. FPU101]
MVRLKPWQWVILALPIASIILFILFAAGWQIHEWGLSWIWAIFTLVFVGWRWLIVQWTNPAVKQIEAAIAEVNQELESSLESNQLTTNDDPSQKASSILKDILEKAKNDQPFWQDWTTFWKRCQEIVTAISQIYYPEVKYPLLNIYVPQAYTLIRGTVDDLDQWMQKLGPALNQVTVGQAYEAYEVYQKLEPSARKLWQVWNWAQWLLNPAAAVAKQATKKTSDKATQQLIVNLGQVLREAALKNLAQQAIALYSGKKIAVTQDTVPEARTQTLRDIIIQAEPVTEVQQKPVNILLIGRTGAGKSSLINTLFQADKAEVDVLPSTDQIKSYHYRTATGETLTLWDTPGYEQVNRQDLRNIVIDYATNADLLILVTPALDPALQMDVDFLKEMKAENETIPMIAVVTQVDRLRPLREWQPPYDWQWGDRPKEVSIREATEYRNRLLGEFVNKTVPIVTSDVNSDRSPWNIDILSLTLIEAIAPSKQIRLARFLKDQESRIVGAAKIIDRYTLQMATTQGLATFLKSPILSFIATLTTGTPTAAYILAQQIPIEQLPVVIGKLQMAYDLFSLLTSDQTDAYFDLRSLWPLLLENPVAPDLNAWAFGHALVEYWSQDLTIDQLKGRYEYYLKQAKV